jgi:hypothetical protein
MCFLIFSIVGSTTQYLSGRQYFKIRTNVLVPIIVRNCYVYNFFLQCELHFTEKFNGLKTFQGFI